MESTFKKALSRVTADDELKRKTADYIKSLDADPTQALPIKPFIPARYKRLAVAACAVFLLCGLPLGAYALYETPTAYVSVDINPSVELSVNTFGKVVKVTPFNTDGAQIIAELQLLHSNVQSAVDKIVKSASQNGFIKEDGSTYIAVTAETNSSTVAKKLGTDAKTGAEDAIAHENKIANVETDHVDLTKHNQAVALGITPGKLNLIEKLQVLDPSITPEDYKDVSVNEIQHKFVQLQKQQVHEDHNDSTNHPAPSPTDTSPEKDPEDSTPPTAASSHDAQEQNSPSKSGGINSSHQKDHDVETETKPQTNRDNEHEDNRDHASEKSNGHSDSHNNNHSE